MTFFGPDIRNGLPIGLGSVAGFGRRAFTPSVLFAAGEQGFWYDPSDRGTLFQDSAGTTPVTGVEQAVGLVLDKSKGLVLGPELVVNGDFSSSAGWTIGAGWTISGGLATGSAASTDLYRSFAVFTTGRTYRVQVVVPTVTSGSFRVWTGGNFGPVISTAGTHTFYGVCGDQFFFSILGASFSGTIDSISIREIAGNHAIQATSASRPTLRARYNLLTYSEDFSNAAWLKAVATVSGQTVTASAGAGFHYISRNDNTVTGSVTVMWEVKRDNNDWLFFTINDSAGVNYFNIATGAFGATNPDGLTATALEDGWYRITGSKTLAAQVLNCGAGVATGNGGGSFTAAGTEKFLIRKVDARRTIDAISGIPSYQRIAAATDYDTVGFPPYLAFDGSDDSLYTGGSIDFSATDKMTAWFGATKLGTAASIAVELSSAITNPGAFNFTTDVAANQWNTSVAGTTTFVTATGNSYASPTTNVLTAVLDLSLAANEAVLRVDGANVGDSGAASAGAGPFVNAPLYIGRRNNASLPFNGRVYALFGRGATTSAALIQQAERWVAGKQGRVI